MNSRSWTKSFDGRPHRTIHGDGWHVELYGPDVAALRYCRAAKQVTFLCEIVDETNELGRKWLFFPTVRVVVFVPHVLTWDESDIQPLNASDVIRDVEHALVTAGELYRIDLSDDVYRQAERDWRTLGPQSAQT